jgi:riboflavin kinase/FMN adenylyltransferase
MLVITIENVREFPAALRGAYITIGNFDGVHQGHQRLLGRLRDKADQAGVPALAVTFDPHPVALLRPDKAPVPLVWPAREIELLENAGATAVGVFRTGPWLLELSARDFFDSVIRRQFAAIGMVEGPNFAFGHDRRGDVHSLSEWCRGSGMDFEVVDGAAVDGNLVSSSLIRERIKDGEVAEAARLLGRPHRVRGTVARGAGRGGGLGFPTLNLEGVDTVVPAEGVYAGVARIDGQSALWPAACNIGPNPTFGESIRKFEAHLVEFSGDVYGRSVEIDFVDRLRGTRKFAGVGELLNQIKADVERTRELCNEALMRH